MKRFNKVKKHTFNNKDFTIIWKKLKDQKAWAETNNDKKEIIINPLIPTSRELLKVLIDESLHGCIWELDNQSVDQMAEDIADFLWKIGFRLVIDDN